MDQDTRRSHYSAARNGGALTPKQRKRAVKKLLHQNGQIRRGAGIEDVPLPATVDEVQQFAPIRPADLMREGLARIPVRLGRRP